MTVRVTMAYNQSPSEAFLYGLLFTMQLKGGKFNCEAYDIDEASVDANANTAVQRRLLALGIDPQACEFDIRRIQFLDTDNKPYTLFFFDIEQQELGAGYFVFDGQIVAMLESWQK